MSQNIPIPKLEDYGLSACNGFLPLEFPVTRLSDKYYDGWEALVERLPALLLSKRLRSLVDKLPVLEIKPELVSNIPELRRAYVVLSFLVNGYIWSEGEPCDTVPDCISRPLLVVSDLLGLMPLASYSSVVLWNFKPIFESDSTTNIDDLWDLSNLTTINTFTGSIDESWFYLVSVFFERVGARILAAGLRAIEAVRLNDANSVITSLRKIAEDLDKLSTLLMRMDEMCDPHVFYFRIRPFLAGWKGMEDAGLPNGVKYGSDGEYMKFAGGSNAQSSLIQVFDVLLGVEHFPLGKKNDVGRTISAASGNSYLTDMRQYMPREHRDFLEHLTSVSNIRGYVLSNMSNTELTLAFDACVAMMKAFRDKHIQIATRYIIMPSKKGAGRSSHNRAWVSKKTNSNNLTGTGGTSLIPFLKQCRDETGSTAASEWGKMILSTAVLSSTTVSPMISSRKNSMYNAATSESNHLKRLSSIDQSATDDSDSLAQTPVDHW